MSIYVWHSLAGCPSNDLTLLSFHFLPCEMKGMVFPESQDALSAESMGMVLNTLAGAVGFSPGSFLLLPPGMCLSRAGHWRVHGPSLENWREGCLLMCVSTW